MKTKNRQNNFSILILIFILLGTVSYAQQENKNTLFTLKSCIQYSLKNHPSTKIYNNNIKIAKNKSTETVANYLPQVNGSVSFDDYPQLMTTVIPAGIFSKDEFRVHMSTRYQTNAAIQLDQTIFDYSNILNIESNKTNEEVADLNLKKNNEDVAYRTAISYYQVMIYAEQEKLLLENEKKYRELLTVLKLQYDKGVCKKVDVDRVQVSLNNILSSKNLIQTSKELALNQLKNVMGMSLKDNLVINDSLNYQNEITIPQNSDFDVHNRIELMLQDKSIELQDFDVSKKEAAFLPVLSGYARYGGQYYSDHFSNVFPEFFDYTVIGLKLSVPIFSGMRRSSQLEQSKLNLYNAQENERLSEENYKLEYQNSWTKLFSSYTNLNTNKDNLELSKEVLDNTSLQYQAGTAALSDFLNADYSYKESQSNYITTLLNFLSARLDYEKSQGKLMSYINQL